MMKKIILILLFLQLLMYAQLCRYRDRVFTDISWQENVVYGNAPQITALYINENTTTNIDLLVDIAMPIGDTANRRPLIIMAHPGGFFSGTKDSPEVTALCDTFAHHGYVTCSMDYRLYFNIASSPSAERAVYRGVQDVDALIRFFAENHSLYGIDTNHIYFIGSSAGAFAGIHHIFMDEANRPSSTFSDFLQPDLGCKSCSGNNFQHQSTIKALVSCWGAVGDTNWIEPTDEANVLLFHGTGDIIVPYDYGLPFTVGASMPPVYGSSLIHERLQNQSMSSTYFQESGEPHEYWGTLNGFFAPSPTSYWASMLQEINQFFFENLSYNPCLIGTENENLNTASIHILDQQIFIESEFDFVSEIVTIDGKIVKPITKDKIITILDLQTGMYILKVISGNKSIHYKFIKHK